MMSSIKNTILEYASILRYKLWALPAIFILFSFILFFILNTAYADWAVISILREYNWDGILGGSTDSLIAHANSVVITIFALSISLTMIVLTLASNQLGPRIIEHFLGSRRTQFVLAYYVATIVFLLLIDARVGDTKASIEIPLTAVIVSYIAVIFSPVIMIFFVSHLGSSIIADNVVLRVGKKLDKSINTYISTNKDIDSNGKLKTKGMKSYPLKSPRSGFIYKVQKEELLSKLKEEDSYLKILYCNGTYVMKRQTIAELFINSKPDSDQLEKFIGFIDIEDKSSEVEDVQYFLKRIVEIALRALSPGINDTYTARSCLRAIFTSLHTLAMEKELPNGVYMDSKDVVRIEQESFHISNMYDLALFEICQSARDNPAFYFYILELIFSTLDASINNQAQEALLKHARLMIKQIHESRVMYLDTVKLKEYEKLLGN